MRRPLPSPRIAQGSFRERCQLKQTVGFTLIELILVMTVLTVVLSVAAPSLSRFFRGRNLDSEAKRFLALTRLGRSRAISEGVPFLLWVDSSQGRYGLQADSSYLPQDDKSMQFDLSQDVQVEVTPSAAARKPTSVWRGAGGVAQNLPRIRFTPDGFISDTSPDGFLFRGRGEGEIWIAENPNHLEYQIETNRYESRLR